MTERPTSADLEAWRVADLSDGFADRVLARLDDRDAAVEPVPLLPPPKPPTMVRSGVVGIACMAVAAALALLWLLQPQPVASPRRLAPLSITAPAPLPPQHRGLDHDAIARAIDEHLRPRAKLCYEAWMINGTPTSGQVIIDVEVVRRNGRGVVTHAAIDPRSELDDRPFRDCLLDTARAMLFEAPLGDEPVQIELPIEFRDPWVYPRED